MSHQSTVLRARVAARLSSRVGLLQVALAGILWGTGGLALELVRDHVPMSVLTVSAWRMTIAAAALIAVLLARRQWVTVVTLMRERPAYAVLVGLFTAGYQALYFASVVSVGVTVATVVSLGLAPVLLTVGEAVQLRRVPTVPPCWCWPPRSPACCSSARRRGSGRPGRARSPGCWPPPARVRRSRSLLRSAGAWPDGPVPWR
jgi:hypothetical protein